MSELGFASNILKLGTGAMDDVAQGLVRNARGAAGGATELEQFAGHVAAAGHEFTLGVNAGRFATTDGHVATPTMLGHFRSMVESLEAAHTLPIRHQAMGAADTARNAARRVIAHLESVPTGHAVAQPKIGEPLFQDLWEAKHGLSEAMQGAATAKVLNNWR
jgi:hypothetical protein